MRRPPRTPCPSHPEAQGPEKTGRRIPVLQKESKKVPPTKQARASRKSVEPKEMKSRSTDPRLAPPSRQTRPPSAPSQGMQNLHLTIFWKALWKSLLK